MVSQLPYRLKEELPKSRELVSRSLAVQIFNVEEVLYVSLFTMMGPRYKERLHKV